MTFEEERVYGYKCAPRFGLGTIGLIKVGNADANAEEAQNVSMPLAAQERMAVLFEQALAEDEDESSQNQKSSSPPLEVRHGAPFMMKAAILMAYVGFFRWVAI